VAAEDFLAEAVWNSARNILMARTTGGLDLARPSQDIAADPAIILIFQPSVIARRVGPVRRAVLREDPMIHLDTQGISLPRLGLGTFRMQGTVCREAVESALALGYRHIDTAEMYANEDAVGAALASASLPRHELHVTTKVWPENLAPDAIRRAFDTSLKKLRLDVVDLYLVHWPAKAMNLPAVLETLMKLKQEGRTRAIGVANFTVALLRQAVEEIEAPIACNQIEYHVMLDQSKVMNYMAQKGIPLVAYCPLAQGRAASDETLTAIGARHNATAAQVALKWLLDQNGVAAIPKASRPESQQANLDALKLQLDDEDRTAIAALPKDRRFVSPAFAPDWDR
jgi:2,5-diketo-D-gluconate reductase B